MSGVRIASLLPAATEIATALGLVDQLVAMTFECAAAARERCPVVVDTVIPTDLTPARIDAWVRDRTARGLPLYELDRAALAAAAASRPHGADLPSADLVVVAPCGYGLDGALAQYASVAARLPGVPLVAIDSASYVVMAGPALVDGIEALAWALHPDAVAPPPSGRIAVAPRTHSMTTSPIADQPSPGSS